MKTAISIPDAIFERAEAQAKAMGVSRSEFYVSAIEQYMERLLDRSITDQINAVLDAVGGDDESNVWAAERGLERLRADVDEEGW